MVLVLYDSSVKGTR